MNLDNIKHVFFFVSLKFIRNDNDIINSLI